jgi:hypothetical protein
MLRYVCEFALANKGHDTRALQGYFGHRDIQHTVRYTELARYVARPTIFGNRGQRGRPCDDRDRGTV